MHATLADCVHRHYGCAAVIVGGAPSRLTEISACPSDAIRFSVNEHGLLAYGTCDYTVAQDPIADSLKGRGPQLISTRRSSADILAFETRCANSAILACFAAWIMGCAPIVVIGVECYAGRAYAHDPFAPSAGFRMKPEKHLERWRILLNLAPGAMVRPVGGPLTEIWPKYEPDQQLLFIAPEDLARAAARGERVRFRRPHEGFERGAIAEVSKPEALRFIGARAAERC